MTTPSITPSSTVYLQMANATFRSMMESLETANTAIEENNFAEADQSLKLFDVLAKSVDQSMKKYDSLVERENASATPDQDV